MVRGGSTLNGFCQTSLGSRGYMSDWTLIRAWQIEGRPREDLRRGHGSTGLRSAKGLGMDHRREGWEGTGGARVCDPSSRTRVSNAGGQNTNGLDYGHHLQGKLR